MVLIYQPPNADVWILLRNAMAAAALKKIYILNLDAFGLSCAGLHYIVLCWASQHVAYVTGSLNSNMLDCKRMP
jgi:hypothetical protein